MKYYSMVRHRNRGISKVRRMENNKENGEQRFELEQTTEDK